MLGYFIPDSDKIIVGCLLDFFLQQQTPCTGSLAVEMPSGCSTHEDGITESLSSSIHFTKQNPMLTDRKVKRTTVDVTSIYIPALKSIRN